jgi:hypothetical protein
VNSEKVEITTQVVDSPTHLAHSHLFSYDVDPDAKKRYDMTRAGVHSDLGHVEQVLYTACLYRGKDCANAVRSRDERTSILVFGRFIQLRKGG